ncbi:MAG: hypothetical protein VW397_08840 [Candidatus Margulisiibacteriota bacterium]
MSAVIDSQSGGKRTSIPPPQPRGVPSERPTVSHQLSLANTATTKPWFQPKQWQDIAFASGLGLAFCRVDLELARQGIRHSLISTPMELMKGVPFPKAPVLGRMPLWSMYMANGGFTKMAGEHFKQIRQGESSPLHEGIGMLMLNSPISQVINRGVVSLVKGPPKKKPSMQWLSGAWKAQVKGPLSFFMRDAGVWILTSLAKDLEGTDRWAARLGIFSWTTFFHVAGNLATARQPVASIAAYSNTTIATLLMLRAFRVGLVELTVNGISGKATLNR